MKLQRTKAQRMLLQVCLAGACIALSACQTQPSSEKMQGSKPEVEANAVAVEPMQVGKSYYGTLQPFAADAVYFVVTDRFVNGDIKNDFRDQGGKHKTFDIPRQCPENVIDNIGYLGGDFKGLLENANYIRDMGFGAVWITPIVDNPDEAFAGGDEIKCDSILTDRGKAGYHGYWGVNFYKVDEHLESSDLRFADLTRGLKQHGLKTVLDIVANHSSPGFSAPTRQPGFGQVFSADGKLLADHQNLPPEQLKPLSNPLHAWYNTKRDLAQLADLNGDNEAVRAYLLGAYRQWIAQGVDAFRIDTVRHQNASFWGYFSQQIRADHPDFFMFGEIFDYEPSKIGFYTKPENGGMSVLDFPMKAAMVKTFESTGTDYQALEQPLYLQNDVYRNAYELTTFYDNHDMARMKASDNGFIDAHHWLFTARGIPVIYYGSEVGFMRGRAEHFGNRNYFGTEQIAKAPQSPIYQALKTIGAVRKNTIALQRGLQLNVELKGDTAVFYRVYQHLGQSQTALVLLNKADVAKNITVTRHFQPGVWRDAVTGSSTSYPTSLSTSVPAHGFKVYVYDGIAKSAETRTALDALMAVVP
jgi:cyclomaltodextrin glucanotransferase